MTTPLLLQDEDEPVTSQNLPHLSYSRISRYLHCPEQYRQYYVENLRPRLALASLVFGKVVHQALAHRFNGLGDPGEYFLYYWSDAKQLDLSYSQKESWDKLRVSGQGLIEKFCIEELPRLSEIAAVERSFELGIAGLSICRSWA